jgi:hypothetical protein
MSQWVGWYLRDGEWVVVAEEATLDKCHAQLCVELRGVKRRPKDAIMLSKGKHPLMVYGKAANSG